MSQLILAIKATKEQATITLKDVGTQDEILSVIDRINTANGMNEHSDMNCGYGARLGRQYFGRGSVAVAGSYWDYPPKRTTVPIYAETLLMKKMESRDEKGTAGTFRCRVPF